MAQSLTSSYWITHDKIYCLTCLLTQTEMSFQEDDWIVIQFLLEEWNTVQKDEPSSQQASNQMCQQ